MHALPLDARACTQVAASLVTAPLLVSWLGFLHRVRRSNASGKHWSWRRRRLCGMAFVELTVALISSIFYLIPNA